MYLSIILFFISFNSLFCSDEIINTINEGSFNFDNRDLITNKKNPSLYLKGLLEINGEKSKDLFIEYYNKSPNDKYVHDAVARIGEYYYCKGLYVKSSQWYKKIPDKYPNSSHLNKSISYFLNSLVISGKTDSAKYYAKYFKVKYPKLKITNEFIHDNPINKNNIITTKNKNIVSIKRYSVQIGTYKNYKSAISKKRILSNEGFLSRVDEVYVKDNKLYSVRIGFYKKKSLALREKNRLSSRLGMYDTIIIEVQ